MRRAMKKLLAGLICVSIMQLGAVAMVFAEEARDPAAEKGHSPSPSTTPSQAMDGAALYQTNCAGCHGSLVSSSKRGRTAAQIQSAINSNTGGMGFLSSLSSAQIQAIATALK